MAEQSFNFHFAKRPHQLLYAFAASELFISRTQVKAKRVKCIVWQKLWLQNAQCILDWLLDSRDVMRYIPLCYNVYCVRQPVNSILNWQIQVSTFDLFFRPILQCGVALVEKPLLDSLGIIVCGTIIKHQNLQLFFSAAKYATETQHLTMKVKHSQTGFCV